MNTVIKSEINIKTLYGNVSSRKSNKWIHFNTHKTISNIITQMKQSNISIHSSITSNSSVSPPPLISTVISSPLHSSFTVVLLSVVTYSMESIFHSSNIFLGKSFTD